MSGPPESPLHESLPPSLYPAQTISGHIFTWNQEGPLIQERARNILLMKYVLESLHLCATSHTYHWQQWVH